MANKQYKGDPVINKKRADLFLIEIGEKLDIYSRKWQKYFKERGWDWDEGEYLNESIVKCYDAISRLGLKDGQAESFKYLFKALNNNYRRQFEYSRVKTKKDVEDIENIEILYSEASEKTTKDLWISFQFQYILEQIEKYFAGNILQIYKCYYYLGYSDTRMDSKFGKDWKKEVRSVNKWIKTNVDFSDLKSEFYKSFPDLDEEVF